MEKLEICGRAKKYVSLYHEQPQLDGIVDQCNAKWVAAVTQNFKRDFHEITQE